MSSCPTYPRRSVGSGIQSLHLVLRARETQKRERSIDEVLRRLGCTQTEIGEAVGLTRQDAAKPMQPLAESLKVLKTQLAKTRQTEEVAAAYNMPLPLATTLDMDSVGEDVDRAEQLGPAGRAVWRCGRPPLPHLFPQLPAGPAKS